jgi:hypothetical protein
MNNLNKFLDLLDEPTRQKIEALYEKAEKEQDLNDKRIMVENIVTEIRKAMEKPLTKN